MKNPFKKTIDESLEQLETGAAKARMKALAEEVATGRAVPAAAAREMLDSLKLD